MKNSFLFIVAFIALSGCDYKPRNQGKALFREHCQNCHMENGQGLEKLMPPVTSSNYVAENPDKLACLIRNGMSGDVSVNGISYNMDMPSNLQLSEIEISNLVHYILEVMNEQPNPYTINDIRAQLEACVD